MEQENCLSPSSVLVVDDDDGVRDLLSSVLSFSGYQVDAATCADSALNLADLRDYTVVLTDINLPGMDGISFCKAIRNRRPHSTVVMISGLTDFTTVRRALQEGAFDFIPKPPHITDIEITISRAILESHRKRSEYFYNDQLQQKVSTQQQVIRKNHINAILALSSALDAKDHYTRGHSLRVASFSRSIAKVMAMEPEWISALELGGLLHDVGKIAIPDSILNKKGTLVELEQKIVRRHPVISHSIASRMIDNPVVLDSILYHHESWDGNGYPSGLKGGQIPLAASIISVADVYDALTTSRPYRKPHPIKIAKEALFELSGTQLNPEVVDAFTSTFGSVSDEVFIQGVEH
jgi:putative two-component system response regulator